MNEHDTKAVEGTELAERDVRALTEYMTVLEDQGRVRGADDLFLVVSQSGREYLVDTREGSCECPDSLYSDIECKHRRRVAFARGKEIPSWADDSAIDPRLGDHVEDVDTDTASEAAHAIATDGGTTVREASEGAEVLEGDAVDPWKGPFAEYDKYGEPTGSHYYRCRDCGREVHEDIDRELVEHRDGCRFGEVSDR